MTKTSLKQNFSVILLRIYLINILYNLFSLPFFFIRSLSKPYYSKRFIINLQHQIINYLNGGKKLGAQSGVRAFKEMVLKNNFIISFNDSLNQVVSLAKLKSRVVGFLKNLIYLSLSTFTMIFKWMRINNNLLPNYNKVSIYSTYMHLINEKSLRKVSFLQEMNCSIKYYMDILQKYLREGLIMKILSELWLKKKLNENY